jgi:hypothetical protein
MTKEDRAKCDRIFKAFEAAFEELSEAKLKEIVSAMESIPGPTIGGSSYTPRWLYDVADTKLACVKYRK